MPATLFKNESRGGGNHGWLRTKFSYSFANYYDPERMGFGALRVVNDDWIEAGAGFPTHGHQNMEIVTIPLKGKLAHKDDAGGQGVVGPGAVQVMSAGTGVLHSEFNGSATEAVELFQIWIEPNELHVSPRYQETQYSLDQETNQNVLLVGPKDKAPAWIHQEAYISRLNVVAGETLVYPLNNKENGVYLLVIEGEGTALEHTLYKRDALEISGEPEIAIMATTKMDILCIEVPL